MTTHSTIESPAGELTLVAEDGALTGVYFATHAHGPGQEGFGQPSDPRLDRANAGVLAEAAHQIGEYFAGIRREFDLQLAPHGEPFQKRVWALLAQIPFGETRTYGQLAEQLGDRNLARAVGSANGRNPLSIVVPCHRVIGAGGALVGYGGGLERKALLLELEQPAGQKAARLF